MLVIQTYAFAEHCLFFDTILQRDKTEFCGRSERKTSTTVVEPITELVDANGLSCRQGKKKIIHLNLCLETTCIKQSTALRDHCSNTKTLLKLTQ